MRRLALLLCALLGLVACQAQDDTWEEIAASGVLRVGIDPTFPPFATADGPDVQGLDVDLARALAEELGLEAQFTYFGYDGLYDALTTRQVDALVSALVIAPERGKEVAYSDSYFDAGQALLVPAGSAVGGMADLAGRTVAVELGALGHVEAQAWQSRLPTLTVVTYGSVEEALDAVAAGQADAAMVDSIGGRLYRRDRPNSGLAQIDPPVVAEPYAIAVRIGDRTLQQRLNEALAALRRSGRLEEMTTRWFGPQ